MFAVHHHDKAGFLALQKVFDDHPRTGVAHLVAQQHVVDGGVRFCQSHGDNHAFARRQAVGLDDDGRAFRVHIIMRLLRVVERLVAGGGNAVPFHKRFGKIFRTFQLCGSTGRAENRQSGGAEIVHNACRQRGFGADNGEGNVFFPAKVDQVGMRRQRQVLQLGFGRGACIAGGDEDSGDFGRLCQFPGQCVFTAAAADNEQFHEDSLN